MDPSNILHSWFDLSCWKPAQEKGRLIEKTWEKRSGKEQIEKEERERERKTTLLLTIHLSHNLAGPALFFLFSPAEEAWQPTNSQKC